TSAIPGRRSLSFACPKESNQRKGHPRVRGHAGIHARVTTRAGSGVRREHVPVLSSNARASCARPRAVHAAVSCACSPRPRGAREEQSAAVPAAEALLFGFPLRSGEGRTEKPRAPHAGGARDRADLAERPWRASWPNPSDRSEPSRSEGAEPRVPFSLVTFFWASKRK